MKKIFLFLTLLFICNFCFAIEHAGNIGDSIIITVSEYVPPQTLFAGNIGVSIKVRVGLADTTPTTTFNIMIKYNYYRQQKLINRRRRGHR